MSWLETLELRLPYGSGPSVEQLLVELAGTPEMNAARIYRRVTVDSDFLLEIRHDTAPIRPHGSELGVRLAAALRRWGVVYHAVWTSDAGQPSAVANDAMKEPNDQNE